MFILTFNPANFALIYNLSLTGFNQLAKVQRELTTQSDHQLFDFAASHCLHHFISFLHYDIKKYQRQVRQTLILQATRTDNVP
jgi:hypothetical protein